MSLVALGVGAIGPILLSRVKDRIIKWAIDKGTSGVKKRVARWIRDKLKRVVVPEEGTTLSSLGKLLVDKLEDVSNEHADEVRGLVEGCIADFKEELAGISENVGELRDFVALELERLEETLVQQGVSMGEDLKRARDELLSELDRKSEFILKKVVEGIRDDYHQLSDAIGELHGKVDAMHAKMDVHERISQEQFFILVEKLTNLQMEVETIKSTTEDQAVEVKSRVNLTVETTEHWRRGTAAWEDSPGAAEARARMVDAIGRDLARRRVVNDYVLRAMRFVPRHAFANLDFFEGVSSTLDPRLLEYVYDPGRPMPITARTNSSAPDVVAIMLSLFRLNTGNRVLFIGAKGGYIQCLTAEIVGPSGNVIVYSTDAEAVGRNERVCREKTPYGDRIEWVVARDLGDMEPLLERAPFDSVFVCGAVRDLPPEYMAVLAGDGSLVAPVGGGKRQVFTVLERDGDHFYRKEIGDFQLVFGPVT
ncbi:MAG: protein-L-isoaspartate O-methyltransferase family protein [Promethearchaeota archaeon]